AMKWRQYALAEEHASSPGSCRHPPAILCPGPGGQCLDVQVAGHGQELNRPALDDDAAAPMLGVSLVPEIGEYRSERGQPGFFSLEGRSNATRTSKSSVTLAST